MKTPGSSKESSPDKPHAASGPRATAPERDSGKLILLALLAVCAILAGADLFYHKHVQFEFERTFAFYGIFGFFAYLAIVNSAKLLRLLVQRPEDYYDD